MPQGKGTYGSKVGRPPRKKYADGTDEESILSRGYDSLVTAYNPLTPINKPLQKIDEAVDDYPVLDSLISPIAKGVNFLSDTADTILNTPRAAVEYVQSRDDETEDGSRGLFGGIGRKGRQERRSSRREARRNKDLPEEQQKGLLVKKGLTKEERQKELDILREEEEVIKAYEAKKDKEIGSSLGYRLTSSQHSKMLAFLKKHRGNPHVKRLLGTLGNKYLPLNA